MSDLHPYVSVEGVTRAYPGHTVFQDLWFGVNRGEFVCLVGHSGCGKTTVLNILAGLDKPDSGGVIVDGVEITGPSLDRAVIFQGHALMPWMTAEQNVAFALSCRHPGWSKPQLREAARAALEKVGLGAAADRKPAMLSGGMKQRVGIARALALQPKMLLMDEPFSALDALTRGGLQDEVSRLVMEANQTAFMITHDVDEAILLADRILLMTNGPDSHVAEVVQNTLPRPRDRANLHKLPGYHQLRDHILEFLLTRSLALRGNPMPGWDRRALPVVRPAGAREHAPPPEPEPARVASTVPPMAVAPTPRAIATTTTTTPTKPKRKAAMNDAKTELGHKILKIKKKQGLKWADIAARIGMSPVWTCALCMGQMSAEPHHARGLAELLGLDEEEEATLCEFPYRGAQPMPPTDPLIYRFYELVLVYGTTWKDMIHEEFGDGIMSAIDYDMVMERLPDQKGDRVKLTMTGKFLSYKRY